MTSSAPSRYFARWLPALLLLAVASSIPLCAQYRDWRDTTLPAFHRIFGISDTTFLIGAWTATYPSGWDITALDTASVDSVAYLWDFARSVGVTAIVPGLRGRGESSQQYGNWLRQMDALADSPRRGAQQRIISESKWIWPTGWGRELEFYPFDATQSPYWQWKFDDVASAGAIDTNQSETGRPLEKHYDSGNATAGQVIAQHIVEQVQPERPYRYAFDPVTNFTHYPDSVQIVDAFINGTRGFLPSRTAYVVVKGHLFEGGTSNLTDSLFKIVVIYEVPNGTPYRITDTTLATAVGNQEFALDTLFVRKMDLSPQGIDPYGKYQQVSFAIRLDSGRTGVLGPLRSSQPANASHRFDLHVYWLGGEKVALRSVALRDSIGEMMLGTRPESRNYQDSVMHEARRLLRGPNLYDTLRPAMMALHSGEEPNPWEFAAYRRLDRMIRDTFNLSGDSLPLFNAQVGWPPYNFTHFHYLAEPVDVTPYVYAFAMNDTTGGEYPRSHDDSVAGTAVQQGYDVPHHEPPQLREHNGGRFHIPELMLTPAAVEDYTTTMQRYVYGSNLIVEPPAEVWFMRGSIVNNLARAAYVSRDRGRRLHPIVGPGGSLRFQPRKDDSTRLDTVVSILPDAAMIRLSANLALCYGAGGLYYWWLGSYTNFLSPQIVGGHILFWTGVVDGGFGPVGPSAADTLIDRPASFSFHQQTFYPNWRYGPQIERMTIDSFYVGYGHRLRAIKWLDTAWLPRVGGEMIRRGLRWRDAYSIHHAAARPGTKDTLANFLKRPLPTTEIITDVRSRSPLSAIWDDSSAIYVELGLFQTKIDTTGGTRDRLKDSNYIYVVNRRTFERPDEISPTSVRGRLMDSLAERSRPILRVFLSVVDPASRLTPPSTPTRQ
jgi:hypothetical protein